MSCCYEKEIESIKTTYQSGVKEFKKKMDILEEVMVMFEGDKFQEFLISVKGEPDCKQVLLNGLMKDKTFENMIKEIQATQIEEIKDLLNDSGLYFKKVIWFYGNTMCTICNPKESQDFALTENSFKATLNISVCYDQLLVHEFEMRVMKLYNDFLVPFQQVAKCMLQKSNEGEELGEDFEILELPKLQTGDFIKSVENCIENEDF